MLRIAKKNARFALDLSLSTASVNRKIKGGYNEIWTRSPLQSPPTKTQNAIDETSGYSRYTRTRHAGQPPISSATATPTLQTCCNVLNKKPAPTTKHVQVFTHTLYMFAPWRDGQGRLRIYVYHRSWLWLLARRFAPITLGCLLKPIQQGEYMGTRG